MRFYKYKSKVEMFKMFDGFLISAKEKLLKPDKAIYQRFLTKFGLKADECVFIDDILINIKGAQSVGITAHQFTGADELAGYFREMGIL